MDRSPSTTVLVVHPCYAVDLTCRENERAKKLEPELLTLEPLKTLISALALSLALSLYLSSYLGEKVINTLLLPSPWNGTIHVP